MIGRKKELEILANAYSSKKPELIAIFGRRRVGKTYLVGSFFEGKIDFELTGLKDGTKQQQLRNFAYSLKDVQKLEDLPPPPIDWLEAFHQLKTYLESLGNSEKRKVIFIDELPWMAGGRSDFLTGFSYFWNSYAVKANIVVVICGSATAWMIQKIINDKGGLHNRVTRRIHLQSFTLAETEAYFQEKHIAFDRYQLLLLYMTMGGIPHYLDQVEGGKSAIQNIDDICFQPQGLLRTEFDNLYSALFSNSDRYESIVSALSSTWKSMSRAEIITKTKISDGGGLTMMLQELEQSGFISSYIPFGKKKKDTLFRLTDCYSLFYLKFIQNIPLKETVSWQSLSKTQTWITWSGYAFENICFHHIDNIKAALGIAGVHSNQYSFLAKTTDEIEGTQIDLLIDRQDSVISLCEVKFYNDELVLTKEDADNLRRKKSIFRHVTSTKKQIFIVLITTFGLIKNKHSLGLIDNVLDMNALF
ncbi:MAG: ATP-binding protein [Arcicella sp.]|nr:ATP-binding protein [Arcicella sp.]